MLVIDEIAAERHRQIEDEGWTPDHDDGHDRGELAMAAACYCVPEIQEAMWPWEFKWWKRKDYRRNLIRAAALIVAEIERLDRRQSNA
jgi:hypothetical protein